MSTPLRKNRAGVALKHAPVSELVVNLAHLSTAPTSRIQPNLSSMPIEIKERIVYWLHTIDLYDDTDWPVDSDAEGGLPRSSKISSKSDVSSAPPVYGLDHWSDDVRSTGSLPTDTQPPPLAIKALCLVDRTFYELCRPRIWKQLDFEGCTIQKLEQILIDIIPRHADCVRSIWWRVSYPELSEFEDVFDDEETSLRDSRWDTEKRSTILLSILQACPRLVDLDIDLHAPTTPPGPMQKFIEPVAKLTSLNALSLSAPDDQAPFPEEFLVTLLTDLNLLESFTCSRISATSPKVHPPGQTCQSPLARRLSTMAYLQLLDLSNAQCVDLSWSKLAWVGPLEKLALEECERVSIEVLFQLTKLFASTLRELELDHVPFHHDGFNISENLLNDLAAGKYNFQLPKLSVLYVSNYLPISFLRAFGNCKSLVELALGEASPDLTKDQLENLIKDQIWPDLRRLKVTRQTGFLSSGDLEGLELYCLALGIEVNIEEDSDDETEYENDYDEDDGFEFDHDDWRAGFDENQSDDDVDDPRY